MGIILFEAPKIEDQVWECSCGGQTFYIVDDSYVQCENCDVAHPIRCKLEEHCANDG